MVRPSGRALAGDTAVERQAVCTIANLVEMVELHDKLLDEQGLAPLVALAVTDDVDTKASVCVCVCVCVRACILGVCVGMRVCVCVVCATIGSFHAHARLPH